MPVNTIRADYGKALPVWRRCRDCYNGEDAVKEGGELYLPKLDSHAKNPNKYLAYLKRALFFNGTARTVDGFSGALFQKEPEVECPDEIRPHLTDITLTGSSLETFGMDTATEVLLMGRAGILVDMQPAAAPDARPYWTRFAPEDIGPAAVQSANGVIDLVALPRDLTGVWRGLSKLGARPLADMLFGDASVARHPIEYKQIDHRHPLFRAAKRALPQLQSTRLWARRSVFMKQGRPLLVTEVFLFDGLQKR